MDATNPTLAALTASALALPGMAPPVQAGTPTDKVQTAFQYSRYQESQNRVHVDVFHGSAVVPIGGRFELAGNWIEDTWGGATPVLSVPASTPVVVSGASTLTIANNSQPISNPQPVQIMSAASLRETRRQLDFSAAYYFEKTTLAVSGGQSEEPDLVSNFFNVGSLWEVNQKMTTLNFGLGYVSDDVNPTTRPAIREHKRDLGVQVAATQILDKGSLLQLGVGFNEGAGFLSNPYKKVFIQQVGVIYDARPGRHLQGNFSAQYLRHIEFADAAWQVSYRFFGDDWGVFSHTLETSWRQPLGGGWLATPRIRYYSQNAADFFAPYFLRLNPDGYYSSDFRLSAYGSVSVGLTVEKKFEQISLSAGFEYYQHKGSLKLGGNGENNYADVNFMLANAALRYEF